MGERITGRPPTSRPGGAIRAPIFEEASASEKEAERRKPRSLGPPASRVETSSISTWRSPSIGRPPSRSAISWSWIANS
ncbi:MAG: hypothetical protein CL910_10240 [Deltaproteobacteria bacterium]|nr:hypothetical protein [Deltaproteobacteria bacterium]